MNIQSVIRDLINKLCDDDIVVLANIKATSKYFYESINVPRSIIDSYIFYSNDRQKKIHESISKFVEGGKIYVYQKVISVKINDIIPLIENISTNDNLTKTNNMVVRYDRLNNHIQLKTMCNKNIPTLIMDIYRQNNIKITASNIYTFEYITNILKSYYSSFVITDKKINSIKGYTTSLCNIYTVKQIINEQPYSLRSQINIINNSTHIIKLRYRVVTLTIMVSGKILFTTKCLQQLMICYETVIKLFL